MSVTVRAPAKINLHLGVGPGREDGYHPLPTVYQAIGVYDDVTVRTADNRETQAQHFRRAERGVDSGEPARWPRDIGWQSVGRGAGGRGLC